jgi:hypothetical protein
VATAARVFHLSRVTFLLLFSSVPVNWPLQSIPGTLALSFPALCFWHSSDGINDGIAPS